MYAQSRGAQNSDIQPHPESVDMVSVTAFGAKGGTVYAPRGTYLFAGSLNVPQAVTLKGAFESVPAHNGIRDAGLPKPGETGTDRI